MVWRPVAVNAPHTRQLKMKSNDLRLQLLDYYERNGIDVASMPKGKGWRDRQDCHWPTPECLGGTEEIPLLKDGHILMDLLVSEEVQHMCFYSRDAKFLVEHLPEDLDSEVTAVFVSLYKKWCRSNMYINPEDGKTELLLPEVAAERGWVGHTTGKTLYKNPDTGETALLTPEEAEERGFVGITAGQAVYKSPETGATALLTREEAEKRGWVSPSLGKTIYRNPLTGETAQLTLEEAEERGWVGFSAGKATYKSLETGEIALLTREEADKLGWVPANQGVTHARVECPYCKTLVGSNIADQHHFDNCIERPGSWRWFKEQMKVLDPKWQKEKAGRWYRRRVRPAHVQCPHCGVVNPKFIVAHHFDNCVEKEGSWRWFKEQMKELDPTWKRRSDGGWRRIKPK